MHSEKKFILSFGEGLFDMNASCETQIAVHIEGYCFEDKNRADHVQFSL
jgi:hypothetical protein